MSDTEMDDLERTVHSDEFEQRGRDRRARNKMPVNTKHTLGSRQKVSDTLRRIKGTRAPITLAGPRR